ncbi:MAG: N-acetyl-gamma-glutamyl-phosphate reductase [Syntrophus sp. PtaB.Bin001]|nr:MAG: N-acetyl-gamma-glutamyl-phosphate reductase [Syntrophus sp. PtaB.Bin001]
MVKVGIYGASGYTGQECLRLLLRHSGVEVVAITSRRYAGLSIAAVYPVFSGLTSLVFMDASPHEVADQADVIFLALPHSESMKVAPVFWESGKKVIDLSADFRLRDIGVYESWYGHHVSPQIVPQVVYGVPELYRDEIAKSRFVANPGCYPTSVILGAAPVLKHRLIEAASVIVDSKSGTSGAGREPQVGSLFCEVNEGFKAYKVGGQHRHTPEIEQELSRLAGQEMKISFTPHLLPLDRGILSTIYATLKQEMTGKEMTELYRTFYQEERFVRIYQPGSFPNVAFVKGSNYCDIGVTVDTRTNRLIIVSAIDNLVKGAAGQAIQNMNILCGFPEYTGLEMIALFP